ncbi:MAG: hypothetical protein HGA94_03940 [Candidatus Aminicenantes bacterium]|nr:hypothetical protein [Candidatus Aminicenantes bacterium]
MRAHTLLIVAVLALGALSAQTVAPAKPADIGGVWEMTMQTPNGDMTADATFVQENDKFKFNMPGPQGMELAGEGTIKGNELEWAVLLSGGMGEMTLTYKAKVEGDTMTGEVQAGDFGAFPFTATKKK